jgi:hypothetical protein
MSGTFQHPVQGQADAVAPAPSRQPPRASAWVALGLAGALVALSVVTTVLAFPAAERYRAAIAQGEDQSTVLTAYDVMSLAWFPVIVAAWLATSIWLFAARRFCEQWPFHHSRSRVWCWLAWAVPVVSLWFPFQVVRDVWWASTTTDHWRPKPPRGVGVWWVLLLAGLFVYNLADQVAFSGTDGLGGTSESLGALGPLNAVASLLLLGAFAAWCRIVMAISRLQESRAAR